MTSIYRTSGRLIVVALAAAAIAACAAPKQVKQPAPVRDRPAVDVVETETPPQISACRSYADHMAGRQMQRDFDSIQGNFQGGSSQVFEDFARMDAQRYYRQLYESCLSQQRSRNAQKDAQKSRR